MKISEIVIIKWVHTKCWFPVCVKWAFGNTMYIRFTLFSHTSFPIAKLYSTVALKELLRPWADKNKIKNKVWECLP